MRRGLKVGQQETVEHAVARTPAGANCISDEPRRAPSNSERLAIIVAGRRLAQAVMNQLPQESSVVVISPIGTGQERIGAWL